MQFKVFSAICFSLDQSKKFSCSDGLRHADYPTSKSCSISRGYGFLERQQYHVQCI